MHVADGVWIAGLGLTGGMAGAAIKGRWDARIAERTARAAIDTAERNAAANVEIAQINAQPGLDEIVNERLRLLLDQQKAEIAALKQELDSDRAESTKRQREREAHDQERDQRISELENQVSDLITSLRTEQEHRAMAEITAETAHLRADDLQKELDRTKDMLTTSQANESRLTTENKTLRARIVALEARILELEMILDAREAATVAQVVPAAA